MFLRDDPSNVARPRNSAVGGSIDDEGHYGAAPRHSFDDIKNHVMLVHDGKVSAGHIAQGDAGSCIGKLLTKSPY